MQSHLLVRRVILALSSLALIVVVFAVYQHSERTTAPAAPSPVATTPPAVAARPTPAPAAAPGTAEPQPAAPAVPVGPEQVPVRGGEKATVQWYDAQGRQVGELTADRWRPAGGNSDEVEVVAPVIRLRTPEGQLAKITADRGSIRLKASDQRSPELRSGRLEGNVQVLVDRLSQRERDALPPDQRDDLDELRRIDLTMPDVTFDIEFASLRTSGDFQIRSAEATLEGSGLSLRYNELDNRLDDLLIERGKRIEARGFGTRINVAMAAPSAATAPDGVAPSATSPPAARATPAPDSIPDAAPPPSSPQLDEDGVPILPAAEPARPRGGPIDEYTAVFNGDVRVVQYSGEQRVGNLTADQLDVLFDFGPRQRDLARRSPGQRGPEPAGGTPPGQEPPASSTRPAPSAEELRQDRIELTWTGKLSLKSKRVEPEPAPPDRQRVHITATGNEVLVSDTERRVECQRLVYQEETERVEIYGDEQRPARVESESLGRLLAPEMLLDRTGQQAIAKGPGRLTSFRSDVDRARSRSTEAVLTELLRSDPATAGPQSELDVRFDERAVATFTRSAAGDQPPSPGGSTANPEVLRSVVFTGNVTMTHEASTLGGEQVSVDFDQPIGRRPFPQRIEIVGRAVAAQKDQYIRAADTIVANLETVELERPPFDLAKARAIAAARGRDPSAIDWAAVQANYEKRKEYRAEVRHLFARQNVVVWDPQRRVDIAAAELDCRFAPNMEIESGLVTPAPGANASVAMGGFSITAPTNIPFDAVAQTAHIAGPGRVTFPARRDLDGRRLETTRSVNIQWSRWMDFAGRDNKATFVGDVLANTEETQVVCGELRVDFRDLPPTPPAPPKFWIFTPLLERRQRDSGTDLQFAGPRIDKDPTFLYAAGNASALTTNLDPHTGAIDTRALIAGPTLAVDLVQQVLRVQGEGRLLIEDYRLRRRAVPSSGGDAAQRITPFGRLSADEPSQTYLTWREAMTYHYDDNVAQFEKDVQLAHRTGSKMKLARSILGETAMEAEARAGQEASVRADALVVRFLRPERDTEAGAGRLSGNEVDAFNASGSVYFDEGGVSAIAEQITYNRQDDLLQIIGRDDAPAQLFDQRKRFSTLSGPKIYWDRRSNQIKMPKPRGNVR